MSSGEQMPHVELQESQKNEMPKVSRSLDFFNGDLKEGVSFSFNDAVVAAQKEMGSAFYLTPESFGEIMPGDWAMHSAGEALVLFDEAYEVWVLQQMGYSPEEVAFSREVEANETSSDIRTEGDVRAALTEFDERFGDSNNPDAPPREEYVDFVWQAFMKAHPELSGPYNPGAVTIELPSSENQSPTLRDEERSAQQEFQQLLTQHPELEDLREDFSRDLETYLKQKYEQSQAS